MLQLQTHFNNVSPFHCSLCGAVAIFLELFACAAILHRGGLETSQLLFFIFLSFFLSFFLCLSHSFFLFFYYQNYVWGCSAVVQELPKTADSMGGGGMGSFLLSARVSNFLSDEAGILQNRPTEKTRTSIIIRGILKNAEGRP
jgi:hypothetical protein